MTRIGSFTSVNSGIGVKKFQNRNSRIQAKKDEINRIIELEKQNAISPEEARMRIATLEAQIQELEFGVPNGDGDDVEIDTAKLSNAPDAEISMTAGQDTRTQNLYHDHIEDDCFHKHDYGKNDYYSMQANYNRAAFGI